MEAAGIKEEEAALIDHLASVAALQSRQAGMEVEMGDSECRWIFDFSRG